MALSLIDRPWQVRRYLYLLAGVAVLGWTVVSPSLTSVLALLVAVGGLLTSVKDRGTDIITGRRIAIMAGYDLAVSLGLALIGLPGIGLLFVVAVTAALSLLRPDWRGWLGVAAAFTGAAIAFLSFRVAGVEGLTLLTADAGGLALPLRMASVALAGATMAWLFGSIGARIRLLARMQDDLRASIEASGLPTLVVDGDHIIFSNSAAVVLAGRPLVGESLELVLDVEDARRTPIRTRIARTGHAPATVDVQSTPYVFDGRDVSLVSLIDVTEIADAQAALAKTQQQLDRLFDRIPVALYRSTVDGEVVAANPALARILGLTDPAELLGDVTRAQAYYDDPERRRAWLAMFDETDVVIDFEMQLAKADGTPITVADTARAVRGEDGSILFFEGVLVDVTAQRELERARQRVSDILEATSDLVWLTDESDRITQTNASMRRFLASDDVIGTHVGSIVLDRGDARGLLAWRTDPDAHRVWSGELELRAFDGTEILTSSVAQRHTGFVSLVARDITDERRTASRLEHLVKAKDEFIASVSHELRTPLTAVVGLASELSSYYDELDEDTRREFIRLVADQASEVAAIVDDLLVAARADTGSISLIQERVELRTSIELVLGGIAAGAVHQFEIHGDAAASGDPQRIRQILRNLVTNAIRYGEAPYAIHITGDEGGVAIAVADKGPGIDRAMIERVFEPYKSAHSVATEPNSVGLGLSVSRWLAEKMGGSLVYENDTMSTFILRLPHALD